MMAIISLLILVRIQMFLKPYKLKINNEIENSSMVAIGFTLYGGLLFTKGQSQVSFIEAFTFILIIVINSIYIMFWIYLMAKTYDRHEVAKKISALLKIVLFRGENDTVLTATEELSSHHNHELKLAIPINKKTKGFKFIKKSTLKQDPLKIEKASNTFKSKVINKENLVKRILKKSNNSKQKEIYDHNLLWDEIPKDVSDSR